MEAVFTMDEVQLNLAFLMDCTASMEPWIQAAKDQITQIIDSTVIEHPLFDVRVGFLGYRDYGDDAQFISYDFTNPSALLHCIRNVHASGGDDVAEDVAGGLFHLRNLSWRPTDLNLIVHIADAPPHGMSYHSPRISDRFPRGDPRGINPCDIMSYFSAHGYDYTFVKINDSTDTMIDVFNNCYIGDSLFRVADLSPQQPRTPPSSRLSPIEFDTTLLTPALTRTIHDSIHRYTVSQDPREG
jgi:hypothetical protein